MVHEIIPKSLEPETWIRVENRVALCAECHEWAHSRGTNNSEKELNELREQRLKEYANTK